MVDDDDDELDVTQLLLSTGRSGMLLLSFRVSDFDLRVNVLSLSPKSKSIMASSRVMSIGKGVALPVGQIDR